LTAARVPEEHVGRPLIGTGDVAKGSSGIPVLESNIVPVPGELGQSGAASNRVRTKESLKSMLQAVALGIVSEILISRGKREAINPCSKGIDYNGNGRVQTIGGDAVASYLKLSKRERLTCA
jgi:hypothetical protein